MACLRTTAPAALLCCALLAAAAGGATAAALPLPEDGACPEGYVVCMDGDGCVPSEALCDGTHDCKDHSDELPFRCAAASSEAPARDKEALEPSAGAGAGGVEAAVGEAGRAGTPTPAWTASTAADGTCISKARMCDSTRDCHDGSDEDALAGCSQSSFRHFSVGQRDAGGGRPERRVGGRGGPRGAHRRRPPAPGPPGPSAAGRRAAAPATSPRGHLHDGTCILRNLTCDAAQRRPDGSDETLACPP
ncbi:Uncharacterized protein GBIM_03769, partial [Gryllus bimaculatus]